MHHFEIVYVECWREGVEEFGFFIERIGEGMWRSGRNGNIVADFSVNMFAILDQEANRSGGHEESLIVLTAYRVGELEV